MKKIIFIAAILLSFSVSAQTIPTVFYDTILKRNYTCLQHPVTWVRNQPKVTRLYVWITLDNQVDYGQLHWELRDSINMDLNPSSHIVANGDAVPLSGDDYQLFQQWDKDTYLFHFMTSDSLNPYNLNILIN